MRKIAFLLALCAALSLFALPVFAGNGSVTYSGDAGNFIFAPGTDYSPTDLFPDFKDVMPGDNLEQEILVKNNASEKYKLAVYLRSLGAADEESADFLSRLNLCVQLNSSETVFDDSPDLSSDLTDWVYLGTLKSGKEANLSLLLTVPVDLDNRGAEKIGYLDWEFYVKEIPISDGDSPKTGWGIRSLIPIFLIFPVFWIPVFILLRRRKEQRDEQA